MTENSENNKKSLLTQIKDKIAHKTVTVATIAATISPNITNSQEAAQNSQIQPQEHTQTATTDIHHTLETTDISEAQSLPVFGSDEWLKKQTPEQKNNISIMEIAKTYHQSNEALSSHINNLYSADDNLANIIIKDNVAEKLVTINNAVTTAQIYLELKAKGITEITDTENNSHPIDILFEDNQELKEIIDTPNFSLDNPENLNAVIEYSINYHTFTHDDIEKIPNRPTNPPIENQSSEDPAQNIEAILKNTPVGNNIVADLSTHHNEINDIPQEEANKKVERKLEKLQKKLNTPTNDSKSVILTYKACVGELTASNAYALHREETNPETTFQQPHHQLKRSNVELIEKTEDGSLAYQDGGKIFISTQTSTNEEIENSQKRASEKGTDIMAINIEYAKGNKIAHLLIALHEACHLTQSKRIDSQSAVDDPSITLKKNTLIEKTAFAVEMLAVANMHKQLKEQGITTFTYEDKDGIKTMPLDNLLDLYPGLKEATKDGFSPDNPQDIRRVVENASNVWDTRFKETYKQQATNAAKGVYLRLPSFSAQLKLIDQAPRNQEQEYNKDVESVLKDVYIGGNTSIDLNHCRDLLDTGKPEEIVNLGKENEHILAQTLLSAKFEDKKDDLLSKETLLKLNTYLESKGIKTDKEKDTYIEQAFTAIVTRNAEAEKYNDIKNILLENGGTIKYADGLIETHDTKTNTITYENGSEKFTLPKSPKQNINETKKDEKSTITSIQINQILQQKGR